MIINDVIVTNYDEFIKSQPIEYWAKRWQECFPATYPPELFAYEYEEYTTGRWIQANISSHKSSMPKMWQRNYGGTCL